jgi:antitoxin (DNA-binding transcriptional repressor) of toxin-antitoxin stability system
MQTITIEEAQGHLAEIIEKMTPGEELIVTRDEKPVAAIRAIAPQPTKPRQFGTLKGTV